MKYFQRCVLNSKFAASKKIVDILKDKAEGGRVGEFASVFGRADAPRLREAGTKHLRQMVRASTTRYIYWVSKPHVVERLFLPFHEKNVLAGFSYGISFLQTALTKNKGLVRPSFSKLVPTTTEASFLFRGKSHVSNCMAEGPLHVKLT